MGHILYTVLVLKQLTLLLGTMSYTVHTPVGVYLQLYIYTRPMHCTHSVERFLRINYSCIFSLSICTCLQPKDEITLTTDEAVRLIQVCNTFHIVFVST